MEVLWEATKVLLNSSKQGQFSIKKCFFFFFLRRRPFKKSVFRLKFPANMIRFHTTYKSLLRYLLQIKTWNVYKSVWILAETRVAGCRAAHWLHTGCGCLQTLDWTVRRLNIGERSQTINSWLAIHISCNLWLLVNPFFWQKFTVVRHKNTSFPQRNVS